MRQYILILRGERAPKKRSFLVKIFQKVPKNALFWPFFKFCQRRRKFAKIGTKQCLRRARKINLVDLKKGLTHEYSSPRYSIFIDLKTDEELIFYDGFDIQKVLDFFLLKVNYRKQNHVSNFFPLPHFFSFFVFVFASKNVSTVNTFLNWRLLLVPPIFNYFLFFS